MFHARGVLLVVPLILLVLSAASLAADGREEPWPKPVPGHVPVQPGEHPRLLFRRSDLPALKARARTPAGKAILKRLMDILSSDLGDQIERAIKDEDAGARATSNYTLSHPAGFGLLYHLTGNKRYADLAREAMDKALSGVRDPDERYSFRKPNGALRAGPSLGLTALGYDLCYDGWHEDYRRKVCRAIAEYNEGANASLPELVRGSRHMPASNHWGMQVGGGALGALAVMGDPGAEAVPMDELLAQSRKAMIRNVTEGFGDHGWFAEGDGTGVMASHIVYLAAIQAWRVAGGLDFAAPRPNCRWPVLKFVLQTIPRGDQPDFPKRGAYPHNVWSRDGMSGPGTFCEGFGVVHDYEKPALLWLYNRVSRKLDVDAGAPFETASCYPHRAVLSFVNWPFGMDELDPAECIPRAIRDEKFGFYACRNRFKDENDILVTLQTQNTRGWHRANTDASVWIWGLGKKEKWGAFRAKAAYWQPAADGSMILAGGDGTHLAVDFSGASGADAMLVMAGPGAGEGTKVEVGGTVFALKFVTSGAEPDVRVQGDKIVVGKQTVAIEDGHLVLGHMAGAWEGPTERARRVGAAAK